MAYGRLAQTGSLWQYDYGQRLVIAGVDLPSAYEVHFSNAENGASKTVIGDPTGVDIPDEYLLSGERIHVWIYLHDGATDGETEYHCIINVNKRARPTDEEPTPEQQSVIDQTIAALNAGINTVEGIAEEIPQTIDEALAEAKASGEFDGKDGDPGFSPLITVADITGGHRVTITDATGSRTVDVMDGRDGEDGYTPKKGVDYFDGAPGAPGAPGADGVSPTVTVTPITDGNQVTITDKTGPHTFAVMDGEKGDPGDPGDPTELIDDNIQPSDPKYNKKTFSAQKLDGSFGDVFGAINQKYEKPSGGIPASDLASGVIPAVPVQDVQIAGTSILSQGVANVPMASGNDMGVMKVAPNDYGIGVTSGGMSYINKASQAQRKGGIGSYRPICPVDQHESTFYGLAKAAGADMASSSNPVGTYTDAAKVAIQRMLGIYEAPWELIREDTFTNATEADHEITVDGNGNAFELTDCILMFETPKQDTASAKGDYGDIRFFYDVNNYKRVYCGAWTQNANANATGATVIIRNENSLISSMYISSCTTGNYGFYRGFYAEGFTGSSQCIEYISNFAVNKINIRKVTGTGHYKLYGKRKWN